MTATGAILYEGPSQLDGQPIVAIATGLGGQRRTTNGKTGSMVQTWIMRRDVEPIEALSSGADASVCGDCVHRVVGGKSSCYVNVGTAPNNVWRAYQRGVYPAAEPGEGIPPVADDRNPLVGHWPPVRIGAYGDPVAVPLDVWRPILEQSSNVTGYTHQWRRREAQPYREFLMASCESQAEASEAQARGWRPFLVVPLNRDIPQGFAWCPSDKLRPGRHVPCEECGACSGIRGGSKPIAIYVHGPMASAYAHRERRPALPIVRQSSTYDPLIRIEPGLHARVKERAAADGMPMKRWAEDRLRRALTITTEGTMLDIDLTDIRRELDEANERAAEKILAELDRLGVGDLVRWYCRRGDSGATWVAAVDGRIRESHDGQTWTSKKVTKKRRKKKASKKKVTKKAGPSGGSRAELAQWRRDVVAEALEHPKGSRARGEVLQRLASEPLTLPDGTRKQFSRSSLNLWCKQIEESEAA